jgi:hypothetical protein
MIRNQVAHLGLLVLLNLLQFQLHLAHQTLIFQAFKAQVLTLHQVAQPLHGLVLETQAVTQVQIFLLLEAHLLNQINQLLNHMILTTQHLRQKLNKQLKEDLIHRLEEVVNVIHFAQNAKLLATGDAHFLLKERDIVA